MVGAQAYPPYRNNMAHIPRSAGKRSAPVGLTPKPRQKIVAKIIRGPLMIGRHRFKLRRW